MIIREKKKQTGTLSKVRRIIIRFWIHQPPVIFKDLPSLPKLDRVVYEAMQIRIAQHTHLDLKWRVRNRQVDLTPGQATQEGERWIQSALARLLPRLAEYADRVRREGSDLR